MPTIAQTARQPTDPDSRIVRYASDESGRNEIYVSVPSRRAVREAPNLHDRRRHAHWRPDGKEFYCVASDRQLMAAEITANDRVLDSRSFYPSVRHATLKAQANNFCFPASRRPTVHFTW